MAGAQCHSRGFILRTVEYGERDIVVTAYARETGKFSAIAKNARGSKRRFGGGLQPMRLLELHWEEQPRRDLDRLDTIEIVEDFDGIQEDFDRITVGSYATDLFRAVTVERNVQPALFDLAVDFYRRLGETEPDAAVLEVLLRHFQLRLFEHIGASPELARCLRCGTRRETFETVYALRTGEGILCAACRRTGEAVGVVYPETFDVLRYFRAPQGDPPPALTEAAYLEQARRLVEAAERRILDGKSLESREMLAATLDTAFEE
jgi:DNA repair protein RecO (recombination protein O)